MPVNEVCTSATLALLPPAKAGAEVTTRTAVKLAPMVPVTGASTLAAPVPNTPDVEELPCVLAATGAGALALLHPKLGAGDHCADGVGAAPPVLDVSTSGALALLYPKLRAGEHGADGVGAAPPVLDLSISAALALLAAADADGQRLLARTFLSASRASPSVVVAAAVPSWLVQITGVCKRTVGPKISAAKRMASAFCTCAGTTAPSLAPDAWPKTSAANRMPSAFPSCWPGNMRPSKPHAGTRPCSSDCVLPPVGCHCPSAAAIPLRASRCRVFSTIFLSRMLTTVPQSLLYVNWARCSAVIFLPVLVYSSKAYRCLT